jgi:hypothetical protein
MEWDFINRQAMIIASAFNRTFSASSCGMALRLCRDIGSSKPFPLHDCQKCCFGACGAETPRNSTDNDSVCACESLKKMSRWRNTELGGWELGKMTVLFCSLTAFCPVVTRRGVTAMEPKKGCAFEVRAVNT